MTADFPEEQLLEWLKRPRAVSTQYEDVVEILHQTNERTRFLKQLCTRAKVLDAGAGDGSLERFRRWLRPDRSDITMFAYAAERGEHFKRYDAHELGYWPEEPPAFGGIGFDAIIACHFIEHLNNPSDFVIRMVHRLNRGGRMFLEWPSENSVNLPPRAYFVAAGVPLVISRFHDDATHNDLPRRNDVKAAVLAAGAQVESEGVIRYPWLEDQLIAHWQTGRADTYALQAAYWSYTKWSQFLVISV